MLNVKVALSSHAALVRGICSTEQIAWLQVATKAGVLNVPEWYEAGSVWVKNNPGFPFGTLPHKPSVSRRSLSTRRALAYATHGAVILSVHLFGNACDGHTKPQTSRSAGYLNWSRAYTAHQLSACAASLLFIQIILTGWVETKRLMDFQNPGTQDNWLGEGGQFKPMDNGYPGGAFFDPFGLSRGSEAQLRKYQVHASFLSMRAL